MRCATHVAAIAVARPRRLVAKHKLAVPVLRTVAPRALVARAVRRRKHAAAVRALRSGRRNKRQTQSAATQLAVPLALAELAVVDAAVGAPQHSAQRRSVAHNRINWRNRALDAPAAVRPSVRPTAAVRVAVGQRALVLGATH